MDRMIRCCLVVGMALLGLSVPFTGKSHGRTLPPTVASAAPIQLSDCSSSFQCQGNTSDDGNGCVFDSGRVPTCQSPASTSCSYGTSGYLCSGRDGSGNPCSESFYGCQ